MLHMQATVEGMRFFVAAANPEGWNGKAGTFWDPKH